MRPAIRILSEDVSNKIAAGEVIERPASIVKELVENAIDAGASRISVEVKGAGKELIRVVDDGAGVPADEAHLAFLRHATSKIHEARDLVAITTLGFRGEALPSIASVSRVEFLTRTKDADEGVRLEVRGQEIRSTVCGAPVRDPSNRDGSLLQHPGSLQVPQVRYSGTTLHRGFSHSRGIRPSRDRLSPHDRRASGVEHGGFGQPQRGDRRGVRPFRAHRFTQCRVAGAMGRSLWVCRQARARQGQSEHGDSLRQRTVGAKSHALCGGRKGV